MLAAGMLSLTAAVHAQDDVAPVVPPIVYSGRIVSSTRSLPEKLGVFADCQDGRERIVGTVEADTYRLDLPPSILCNITVGEQDWAADVQPVYDARTAIFLLFALIRRSDATKVTGLLYLTPPTTAVMAWLSSFQIPAWVRPSNRAFWKLSKSRFALVGG